MDICYRTCLHPQRIQNTEKWFIFLTVDSGKLGRLILWGLWPMRAMGPNPQQCFTALQSQIVANLTGCSHDDTKQLVQCLKEKTEEEINNANKDVSTATEALHTPQTQKQGVPQQLWANIIHFCISLQLSWCYASTVCIACNRGSTTFLYGLHCTSVPPIWMKVYR